MEGPDEFISAFSASTEDDKQEAFEQSTLKLVLKQLGATTRNISIWENELGTEFSFDWFNTQGFVTPHVRSFRVFTFNFVEAFTRPTKSPLVEMFRKAEGELGAGEPLCVIFKCYKLGRLSATNIKVPDMTHLHISAGGATLNILPFAKFFSERYGFVIQG